MLIASARHDCAPTPYFESALRNSAETNTIRCVHSSLALFLNFLISGVGGEITEDERKDFFVLRIPRWEVEQSLSFLRAFPQRKILLFHTPPVGALDLDRGNHKGSRVVNDMIEKYKPSLVFCGHAHNSRGREEIGGSLVVNPGSLKAGNYALVDSETREVEFRTVEA